jgi:autotransporter translocation and assembly factor TamB
MLVPSFASDNSNRPVNVTGKWQLSWEARLGTERGTVQIEQIDSKLTGTFQGRLGSPKVSGSIQGTHVSLTLDFQGATPFSLVFTGTVEGDKMTGRFEVQGVGDGYDSHGENAHPTDYSWTTIRQPDRSSARQ